MFERIKEALLDIVAPRMCAACDGELGARAIFCAACRETIVPRSPVVHEGGGGRACRERVDGNAYPTDRETTGASVIVVTPYLYGGALATAITRLKYRDRPDLAAPLAQLLLPWLEPLRSTRIAITHVPLHPERLAARGYNQSALVAARIARLIGARSAPHLFKRTRATAPQVSLERKERLANMRDAFELNRSRAETLKTIDTLVIIDDVRTTGATLGACAARVLAHAPSVAVVTMAIAQSDG